jgi:hypothetical protein
MTLLDEIPARPADDAVQLAAGAAVDAADVHPLVAEVRAWTERVLRPDALRTDRCGVGTGRVRELAEVGLLGREAATAEPAVLRRLHELVAGACFNTWLVWAQHVSLVARVGEATPLARRAARGEVLLGAGVSDVRRYPQRYVRATRVEGGWRLDGTLSWVSGWGLHAGLYVSAIEPETETVVSVLAPIGPGMAVQPLRLSAMQGSRTDRVVIDGVLVGDDDVLARQSLGEWRRADVDLSSDARPHHFGLAETLLRELDETGDVTARTVATAWRPRITRMRGQAYALADQALAAGGAPYRQEVRLALKVDVGELLGLLSRALLAARSGHGLTLDDTAQLHARSALFALVQGQSPDVRRAQLLHLGRADHVGSLG